MTVFRNQRLNQIAVLAAILVVAAVLRFASLSQRGLIYWDEAKFAMEGVRLHAYIQAWFGSAPLDAGKTIGTAKPTHALLIAVAYFILGVHTYAPLFLDAFCSVLGVGVAFLIGRRLFGPWVGLVGALLLAVSEYDVIYARSVLSESDANLLFLIAVFLWIVDWERISAAFPRLFRRPVTGPGGISPSTVEDPLPPTADPDGTDHAIRGSQPAASPCPWPTRMLVASGVLAGAAFTANYRLGIYIVVLVLFDLVWFWKEFNFATVWRRAVVWVAGSIAAPLLWQIVDLIARATGHVLFRSEVNIVLSGGPKQNQPELYLEQMIFQLHGSKGTSGIHFDPGIYIQWFVVREGWVIPVLLLAGLLLALWFRQLAWMALFSLVVFPYLVYVFAPFVVPRNIDAVIPFACLLAAAVIVTAAESIPRDAVRRLAVAGLACAIAVYGAFLSWRLTGERSGIAQAAAYVQSHHGRALGSNEIMVWYFPGPAGGTSCAAPGLPGTRRQLATDRAAGYRYAETETIDHGLASWLAAHAKLVRSWPAWGNLKIGENPVGTENGYPPAQNPEYVMLYDLKGLVLPPAGNASVSQCIRNVPI